MLRKLALLALAFLGLVLPFPRAANASGGESPFNALPPDGALHTLSPNARTWFRFDYHSVGTPIQILLTDSGRSDISFTIYTPEQIDQWHAGRPLQSVGQIVRAGGVPDHNLIWNGKFKTRGAFYVTVQNPTNNLISFRLFVTGPAISLPPATAGDAAPAPVNPKPASEIAPPPAKTIVQEDPALRSLAVLSPDLAHALAAKNGGVVALAHPVRLIAGALYTNISFQIVAPRVRIIGDPIHPPTIIPPGGSYGVVARDLDSPAVESVNILTSTLPQDRWRWYAEITSAITDEQKYGGVLFVNTRNGIIKNITIVGADGTTDGSSHSAGIIGVTLLNNVGTLLVNNQLNGNIFGVIIAGGKSNILLDNTITNNIRQGLVPGTGDLCNGCDSAGVALTYGSDGVSTTNNIIGLPGHGNRISGGNAVFVICKLKQTGGGGGNHNFFVENTLWAEWNAFEAVATVGNVFVRNVINFSKNTVGYWLTGSDFIVDSRYKDGLLGSAGKIQAQVTDRRADNNLSGAMRILDNPPTPNLSALPPAVHQYLQQFPPHSPYDPIP